MRQRPPESLPSLSGGVHLTQVRDASERHDLGSMKDSCAVTPTQEELYCALGQGEREPVWQQAQGGRTYD